MSKLWIILGIIGAIAILLIVNHDQGTILGIQNGKFAQMLYLGIWGSVIAVAILPRKHEWKNFARNAAAWIGIFLVAMALYIYRYDLQDIASRMTAGLIPGSPVSSQTVNGREQVMLIKGSNGHFNAKLDVEGTQIDFLVDTGASSIVISHQDALKLNIDPANLRYNVVVSTANGTTSAAKVRLKNVSIGKISRNNLPALVAQPGNLSESLLGMNFLETLWGFEFRGDRLILTD